MFEGMFSPLLTLALFSRVLAAPQRDWPPNVRTTGFVLYNGPDRALAPELTAFLSAGPPPVVFTLGTSAVGAAGRLYHESTAAAARVRGGRGAPPGRVPPKPPPRPPPPRPAHRRARPPPHPFPPPDP